MGICMAGAKSMQHLHVLVSPAGHAKWTVGPIRLTASRHLPERSSPRVSQPRATLPSTCSLIKSTAPWAKPKSVTFEGDRPTYYSDEEVRFNGGFDKEAPLPRHFSHQRCFKQHWAAGVVDFSGGRHRCSRCRGMRMYLHCLKYYPWCDFHRILLSSKP
jgi:hypothetical protein